MAWSRMTLIAIGVAALVAIASNSFMPNCEAPPRPVQTPPQAESATSDAEAWSEQVAATGRGVVRIPVVGSDGSTKSRDIEFVSKGPLSDSGTAALNSYLESSELRISKEIDKLSQTIGDSNDNESTLSLYSQQLSLIADLERQKLIRKKLATGNYVTVALSNPDVPPLPGDASPCFIGPFQLRTGELAQALFIVDMNKHDSTRDIMLALQEIEQADRDSRIRRFNEKPLPERRSWIDRYMAHLQATATNRADMSADSLRELLAMEAELRFLRASVDQQSALWLSR